MAPVNTLKPRIGYADLVNAPEDGRRYELYDGEVLVVASPMPLHQLVSRRLAALFESLVAAHGGTFLTAPIDIVFSEYDVLMPDLVFFAEARKQLVPLDAAIREAPDLAVEILSPSTAATDRGRKMQMFASYGVREYWIIDPVEERLEIHTLTLGGYELAQVATGPFPIRSPLMPELDAPVESLFPLGS
ncbi:MAG TPA: Uma2 family endonuclease [Vicinamibacterales bacterium]|jgi:Uma2 family endonuclease|nr:Uma2 family endonuclease [Vicinamibacterales bacterium]